jgi:hypothetical protein
MTSTRGSDSHTFANYLDTDTAMRNTKKPLRKMNASTLYPLLNYLSFRTHYRVACVTSGLRIRRTKHCGWDADTELSAKS